MRKTKYAKYAPRTPICLEERGVCHLNATLENVPPTIATKKRDRVIGGGRLRICYIMLELHTSIAARLCGG